MRSGYAACMSALARCHPRLRRLFGLALFAWLLLALSPIASAGIGGGIGMVTVTATAHAVHQDMPARAAGCCADGGQPAHPGPAHACTCAMLCTALLPATALFIATGARVSDRPAPPPSRDAPLSGFAPPLRPPLG